MLFRIAPRDSLREGPVLTQLPAQAHNSGARARAAERHPGYPPTS